MRISDWSSDVCSSDLLVFDCLGNFGAIVAKRLDDRVPERDHGRRLPNHQYRMLERVVAMQQFGVGGRACDGPTTQGIGRYGTEKIGVIRLVEKIGRASCRERVCQYV